VDILVNSQGYTRFRLIEEYRESRIRVKRRSSNMVVGLTHFASCLMSARTKNALKQI